MMTLSEVVARSVDNDQEEDLTKRPLVSVVVPAYNEAPLVQRNLARICDYMESLADEYRWELIVVNDGSTDGTGKLAETFAGTRDNVHVLHHPVNLRLAQALKHAFVRCGGDYVITIDIDLSYAPYHIGELLTKIKVTKAKVVIASPYMKGGKASNIPFLRRFLSLWANRFLSATAKGNLSTFTSMVRAYDGKFLQTLDLRADDVDIHAEIIYKAMLLRARIVEIPAHLDWGFQEADGLKRRSSMKIMRSITSYLLSGFIFKPFMFFIAPGLAIMALSTYTFLFVLMHTLVHFQSLPPSLGSVLFRFGASLAAAFQAAPHAFVIGGMSLMIAIQLISLGILSLQSKRYFEELFHLGTTNYRSTLKKQ
jgi:glycosyltransferase involved in cell wall biosynthesis